MKIDGRCHCGYVTFEAEADPETTTICNCTGCQTMSGAPLRAVIITRPGTFVLLSGKPTEYRKTADSEIKTARSCTSAAAINECYQSPRSAILHSQRSNPHSDRPATDRTYSSAAPPPYLPRFPPLEVFGSPARTPAYLGSHVVHGPASENLHNSGREQVQQIAA